MQLMYYIGLDVHKQKISYCVTYTFKLTRWDEKAGLLAGCDTLPMFDVLEAQGKGDRR